MHFVWCWAPDDPCLAVNLREEPDAVCRRFAGRLGHLDKVEWLQTSREFVEVRSAKDPALSGWIRKQHLGGKIDNSHIWKFVALPEEEWFASPWVIDPKEMHIYVNEGTWDDLEADAKALCGKPQRDEAMDDFTRKVLGQPFQYFALGLGTLRSPPGGLSTCDSWPHASIAYIFDLPGGDPLPIKKRCTEVLQEWLEMRPDPRMRPADITRWRSFHFNTARDDPEWCGKGSYHRREARLLKDGQAEDFLESGALIVDFTPKGDRTPLDEVERIRVRDQRRFADKLLRAQQLAPRGVQEEIVIQRPGRGLEGSSELVDLLDYLSDVFHYEFGSHVQGCLVYPRVLNSRQWHVSPSPFCIWATHASHGVSYRVPKPPSRQAKAKP